MRFNRTKAGAPPVRGLSRRAHARVAPTPLMLRGYPVPHISRVGLALLCLLTWPLTTSATAPPASLPHPSSADLPGLPAPGVALNDTRRTSFNDDWRFFRGEASAAEQPEFDDSHWTPLRLPHDWAIDGP